MAKSRRKPGAGARGRYKRKRLGKGYSTIHKPQYLIRVPRKKTENADEAASKS
jgi:hypothetical protein